MRMPRCSTSKPKASQGVTWSHWLNKMENADRSDDAVRFWDFPKKP